MKEIRDTIFSIINYLIQFNQIITPHKMRCFILFVKNLPIFFILLFLLFSEIHEWLLLNNSFVLSSLRKLTTL